MGTLPLVSFCILVSAASSLWAPGAGAQQTLRYTILSNGRTAGSEVDVYSPDRQIDCTFEYNDRGSGPKVAAHYRVALDGLPLRTDVTGNDSLKAPVDEHFAVEDGRAHWKSTSEEGRAAATGFYISNNAPAAETAFLVVALLKGEGRSRETAARGRGEIRTADRRDSPRSWSETACNRLRDHGA